MGTMVAVRRLRRDATLTGPDRAGGTLRLEYHGGQAAWRDLAPGVVAALRALASADLTEVDLGVLASRSGGLAALGQLHQVLRRLDGAGMLEHAVRHDGQELARLRPVGRGPFVRAAALPPDAPVKLSRFATARAEGGRLVLAAPTGHLVVELAAAAAGLLGGLADWVPAGRISSPGGVPDEANQAVLGLLADAGLLAHGGPETDRELVGPDQAQWTVPDLWLHARSRGPRLSAGYGGSYPGASRVVPLSVTPPPREGTRIELVRPDLEVAAKRDPPFTEVLEGRRSIREHDAAAPITRDSLAELLYRSVRIRRTFPGGHHQRLADRPYPAGGSIHELEVYPLVTCCDGVPAGLWHYAAADHALELVREPGAATRVLVEQAKSASLMAADPQVLLVITARFGRLMWKYDTIAYALLLKGVGVLYQTVYLVGTAMGLAVCGLGGGDAADFATASGLDYYAEGSVGELVLGSRPAVLTPRWDTGGEP